MKLLAPSIGQVLPPVAGGGGGAVVVGAGGVVVAVVPPPEVVSVVPPPEPVVVDVAAWAADRPVIPISSLAATAQTAVNEGIDTALVTLDARMNEVFTGTFEAGSTGIMVPVTAERVCGPEQISKPENPEAYGVGNGFDRYEALGELAEQLKGIHAHIWPKASSMLQLAKHWLKTNEPLPAERAQPVYLRDNVAKKEKDR